MRTPRKTRAPNEARGGSIGREPGQEVRDEHGRTFKEPDGTGLGREFFVTVVDGPRTGYLLGPYGTHGEALKNVDRGRELANKANGRAVWYAYGTVSAPRGTIKRTVFGQ